MQIMNIDYLKSLLRYDPEEGHLYWVAKGKGKVKKRPAGTKLYSGYIGVLIDGKRYQAHRLAWALYTGDWPTDQIDHINGCKTDNRVCNLREATNAQNGKNIKVSKANKTGFPGVSWSEWHKKYRACIKYDHKQIYLGAFEKLEDAVAARRMAEDKYFGEWKRGTA